MTNIRRLIATLMTCAAFALGMSQSFAQMCTPPQFPQGGVCVDPAPTCMAPQYLLGGVCVNPASTCVAPMVWNAATSTCVAQTVGSCVAPMVWNAATSTCVDIIATCTATPTDPICTGGIAVTIAQCTATPTLAGCSTLIATCSIKPTDPICTGGTAVTIDQCTADLSLPGCAALCAVSPGACPTVTYAQCTATPSLAGCAPLLDSCAARPTDPICTGGTATIAQCSINPALAGCTSICAASPGACPGTVTIAQCSFNPALPGCTSLCAANPGVCSGTAVTIAQCAANPALPGCAALCTVSSCSCAAPRVLQNGVCVTPVACVPPQVLQYGICATPVVCAAPKVFQAGICVTRVTAADQVLSAPAANVSVDSTGALVVAAPTAPIVLSANAQENTLVRLDTLQPVSFTSGNTTLRYTDQVGAAQLVVRTVDNKPQLEVAQGTVHISSPSAGNTISVMSSDDQRTVGSIVTQTDADSVVVVKTETTAKVFVDSGKVNYQGPGQSTPIPVYRGENTRLDALGNLSQIALGSLDGLNQVPGDPLPVQIDRDPGTKIPVLEGSLPRFDNAVSLLDIVGDQIKLALGDTTGQLSYDRTTGVITYMLGNTAYRLIALGDVLVDLNQFAAASAAASAGGAYALASRGIQLSLSGALGYFSDLQTAVRASDTNGALNLKPTGAIEALFGGGRYVVMPGLSASLPSNPNPLPGFESDASGYAVFRDHLGTLQTLYPAFLDVDTLNSTSRTAEPTAVLTNNGDGTVTADIAGQRLLLRPEYPVISIPTGHEADPYWQDNGLIYLRNSDESAQGFRIQ